MKGVSATIRPANRGDRQALLALVEGAYRGESARGGWTHEADLLGGQRIDLETLSAMIEDPDQRILVAVDAGTILGCVQIARKGDAKSYLGMLTVDPLRQAGGFGAQLIRAAEQAAVECFGARQMEITVIKQLPPLIAYYIRRGYSLTGEERPFPVDNPRFGIPKASGLAWVVLTKTLPHGEAIPR